MLSKKRTAELRRASRASGAPWVRKFGKPSIRENLVITKRTPVHSLRGREGNQVSARPGEEYVINRAMHLCNPPFSWREIAQEMASLSSRSKTCLLQLLHCISCFEKIVMATNTSGLNSNYLLVRRATGKRKKRKAWSKN